MRKVFEKKSGRFQLLLAALLTTALLWGCGGGSSSYDTPVAASNPALSGHATNVVIEPATLKSWMDDGLVNNSHFDQRVVILDFAAATDASKPRIPGAQRVLQGDLQLKRFEGVGDANPMVATGAQMDAVIQRLGINDGTVIVFTTPSTSAYYATRAYWTFRYWGFPKERLRFLNGGNAAFAAEYESLMTDEEPVVTPSTYSVRNLAGINDDLRASVGEMISILPTLPTSTTNVVIDARGENNYLGKAATPGQIVTGSVVVFDGHPEGGQFLGQGTLFLPDSKFKTADQIKDLFAAKGWAPGKKVTVYCTTGYSATPLFFALDAILDTPVQLFDGSWSVLGKYSQNTLAGGQVPIGSAWAIDKYLDPATMKFNNNISAGLLIEPLHNPTDVVDPFIGDDPTSDSDVNPAANQIEEGDKATVGNLPTVTIADPELTATASALIEPSKLQEWMNAGLVNKALGSERVVILDVTSPTSYAAGHIPGAQLWNSGTQAPVRAEGPAEFFNMPLMPEDMNARIQALGIDENTTIVLTTSQTASYVPSRAYFTFRYYGWPKSRLKVLNGYNFAWEKSALTTTATDLADSTLTVQAIGSLQPQLRAALPELMDGIRDNRGIPVDFRGPQVAAAGSTPGGFDDDHTVPPDGKADADYVVFEGTIKGGKYYNYNNFQMDPANGDYRFKSALVIRNELAPIGLDGSKLIYSICRGGNIATTAFFVLEALLDWPVMVYDGSWSQWGMLSANAAKGGQLPADSSWAVDNATYMDKVNYNKDALKKVEPLNPDSAALLLKPSDAAANQIEKADAEYQSVPPASTGGTAGPPTAGGGSAGGGC